MNHRYLNGYSYEPTWSQFFMTSSGRRAGLLSLQVLWLHVCLIISPNPLCPPSCPAPQPLSPPRPPVAECDINPEPLGMDCVMSHRLSVSFLKSKHCQFPSTIAPLVLAEGRACCMATVGLPPEAPCEKVRVCSWKKIFLSLPLWLLFVSLAAPSLPVITPSLPLLMPFSPSQPPDTYYWVCREWHKPCLPLAALLWP